MCGRFALTRSARELAEWFELESEPELTLRYNVAPSQPVASIASGEGVRRLAMRSWGLVPHWAKTFEEGPRMINARSETAAEKPAFRDAFRKRRCVVPADGFYEWSGGRGSRTPHWIFRADGAPMAFAGLFESWHGEDGEPRESCSVLTTTANRLVARIHDRMPAILERDQLERWLDPSVEEVDAVAPLLIPAADGVLDTLPVDDYVNDVRHDDARCLDAPRQASLF